MKTDLAPHRATFCPNCNSQLGGNFCPQCGQPAHLHVPSAREFLHEFIAHYVALEGKLWKSLGLLMFKPGQLTREYVEGRRVPYVEPLRLYLSFSIIFFAIFKFGDIEVARFGPEAPPAQSAAATPNATPPVPAPGDAGQARAGARPPVVDGGDEGDDLLEAADNVDPTFGAKVRRFIALPGEQKDMAVRRAFFSYAPYAIFALMPLFALYLKLLYLGAKRRYGEHLLFALHANAFAFLMLSVLMVLPPGIPLLGPALALWLLLYLPMAMRRVYGGGRFVTALRWLTLMSLHVCSMVFASLAVVAMAAVA